jgi:hypothetical protein
LRTIHFIPQWVTGAPQRSSSAEIDDPEYQIKWFATFKGGVYGISGNMCFLLVTSPGYLGAEKLELAGDSLLVYTQSADDAVPLARYNRRSKELRIIEK